MTRTWLSSAVVAGLGVVAACGGNPKPQTQAAGSLPATTVQRSRQPQPRLPLPIDPITALIETSQRHFESGRARVQCRPSGSGPAGVRPGRRGPARIAVRRAHRRRTARTFRSPGRSHQRVRGHGARAGRRLRREELRGGADRRAAEERDDVSGSAGGRGDESGGRGRPRSRTAHDIPIPQKPKVLSYVEVFQGAAARLHPGEPARAARSTCR